MLGPSAFELGGIGSQFMPPVMPSLSATPAGENPGVKPPAEEPSKPKYKAGLQSTIGPPLGDKGYYSNPFTRIKPSFGATWGSPENGQMGAKAFAEFGDQYQPYDGNLGEVKGFDSSKYGGEFSYSRNLGKKNTLTGAVNAYYKNKQKIDTSGAYPEAKDQNSLGWGLNAEYARMFGKFDNGMKVLGTADLNYGMDIPFGDAATHRWGANLGGRLKYGPWGLSLSGGFDNVLGEGSAPVVNFGVTRSFGGGKKKH